MRCTNAQILDLPAEPDDDEVGNAMNLEGGGKKSVVIKNIY